jgi:general secretion pathway protein G
MIATQNTTHTARRRAGFTLIEIMAVVLIMGLLAALVGTQVAGQIGKARGQTAKAQIKKIESAVEFFQMDNGFFPDSEQGLEALVVKPTVGREARNYPAGGYLQGGAVPRDPWDNPYQYEYPGTINANSYDIWSLGADGQPGGEGSDADIGNWSSEAENNG